MSYLREIQPACKGAENENEGLVCMSIWYWTSLYVWDKDIQKHWQAVVSTKGREKSLL